MPAGDYEAVVVGNIGSYGRMVPVHETGAHGNVGGGWTVTAYTVPPGRVLCLDAAHVTCYSGVTPNWSQIALHDSGGIVASYLARELYAVDNTPVYLPNRVWVPSGWTVRFRNSGGDGTTDMIWSISGRLFDWSDFGSP
jgi:hypothetical protein